jgi:hemoglobin-like flavoprotein
MKFFAVLALCIVGACAAPLTSDEATLIKSTFAQIKNNEVDILYNFFEMYPAAQARFPAFVGKDLASLKDTAKFATHATRIISALSDVVELSGNAEAAPALKTVLTTLGSDHKRRGIPKESFADFETAFLSYLKANVAYGDNVEAAWKTAFENSFEVFFTAY